MNDIRRLSSMVRITIPVTSDFIQMRNTVIETLISSSSSGSSGSGSSSTSTSSGNHDSSNSSDINSNTSSISRSTAIVSDAIGEVHAMCTRFVNDFFGHRASLSDSAKVDFDRNWAFLLNINTSDDHHHQQSSLTSIVPYTTTTDTSIDAMVHVISSEILLVHQYSAKAIGQ